LQHRLMAEEEHQPQVGDEEHQADEPMAA
jgi:hypothetical protein